MKVSTDETWQANLKEVNKLLTYAIVLDSLILAYVHFMVMLIELQKVQSQQQVFV
jgi:hypothetical protein